MKKLLALLIALMLALCALTPALSETAAEAPAEVAEAAAEEPATEAAAEAAAEEPATEAAAEAAAEEPATEAAAEAAAEEPATEAAAEAAPEPSPIIKKLLEVPWYTWAVLAAMVAAAALFILGGKKTSWTSRQLSMGAMCIAIAFVLSCIHVFHMPQGGFITPASMLPLVLFMVAFGPIQGFIVGCAFGLLQLITDPYVIHPIQLLVDYPLAFGAMILGCLATHLPVKDQWKLPIAVLLAGVGRYVMAVLSGAIFFAEYAGEQNAWVYSLVYNITYLGPDTLICAVVACVPGMPRLVKMIRGESH